MFKVWIRDWEIYYVFEGPRKQKYKDSVYVCVCECCNHWQHTVMCVWNLKNLKVDLSRSDSVCVWVAVGMCAKKKKGLATEGKKEKKLQYFRESSTHRMTFSVSTHSGCKHSQESTVIHPEFSEASLAISTRWQASINPFFLYASPTGEMMPLITLYWPTGRKVMHL